MLLHNIANVIFTDLYINSLVPNIKYICIQQNNNSDIFAIVDSTSPVFGIIIIVIVYAFLCLLFFFLQLCKYFKQTRKREREREKKEREKGEREILKC